ncbi:hypothetical protein KCP75_00910 [Salmonella enterica subsp. enterica]|nr:hypothetical protein KCP75_00910 [Salmonella enterica subsp. enterica]
MEQIKANFTSSRPLNTLPRCSEIALQPPRAGLFAQLPVIFCREWRRYLARVRPHGA